MAGVKWQFATTCKSLTWGFVIAKPPFREFGTSHLGGYFAQTIAHPPALVGDARIRNAEVRASGSEGFGTDLAKSWNVFLAPAHKTLGQRLVGTKKAVVCADHGIDR